MGEALSPRVREAEQQAFDEALEQIRLADEVGFNTVWMVEHHFREGRSHCSAPEVFIGALTQLTHRIRLGFGVTLMPHGFTHPARVAEKVATADILSKGRVEWGTGRSSPPEQIAFGVPTDSRSKDQWRRATKTVVEMWTNERYEEDSDLLHMPSRPVLPKPYQLPHPPCWLAATSDESAQNAGKAGVGLMSFTIFRPLATMAEQIRLYREAVGEADPITKAVNDRVAAYTLVHCCETEAEAQDQSIWDAVWWWYRNLADTEQSGGAQAEFTTEEIERYYPYLRREAEADFDPVALAREDMIIVATPEQCVAKMRRYEAIGVDQLICLVHFGDLSHEAVLRSIRLLGERVIPELSGTPNAPPATRAAL